MKKKQAEKESGMAVLLRFAGGGRLLIGLSLVLAGISSVLGLLPYVCIWNVVKSIFDHWNTGMDAAGIIRWGVWAAVFSLGGILVNFLALICSHKVAYRTSANMRKEAVHHMIQQPLGFFSKNESGKLRRTIEESAGQAENFLSHLLPDVTGAIVSILALLVLLFLFDWRMGLAVVLTIVCAILFYSKMMGQSLRDKMKEYQNSLDHMNNEAVEYIRGISEIKTFQQSVFSLQNFRNAIENYRKWTLDFTYEMHIPQTGYTCSINGSFALLIPLFFLLLSTASSPVSLVINLIFYMMLSPYLTVVLSKIMAATESTFSAMEGASRISALLRQPLLADGNSAFSIGPGMDILFQNVSFSYEGKREAALKDITFAIQAGKTTALVGPSGSGKSTVAALIPRFYDPNRGQITIGGADVRKIHHAELMNKVAFVFQNTRLIKGTIAENIRMGRPEATDKEVIRAAELAQCGTILEKFPKGIQTEIGAAGVHLSGGETQRLAIARAILKDAPILLLDEATAFADPENEVKIQVALQHLTRGKTVLIIAHRLTTVRHANRILVMENGRLAEQGGHEELLEKNGLYRRMWEDYQASVEWDIRKAVQ